MCKICSKLTSKALEEDVKFVQSQQQRHKTMREICSKFTRKTLGLCMKLVKSNQ